MVMDRSPLKPLLLLLLSLPGVALAASLSGQVQLAASRTPASNAELHIDCGSGGMDIRSDGGGQFRIEQLPIRQWCRISLRYRDKESTAVRVFLGEHFNTVNLSLLAWQDQWLLRKQ
jgi:hypothetical protein